MNKYLLSAALGLASVIVQAGEKVDRTLDADADGFVQIEHVNGYANIKGWDKNQVRVVGELGERTERFIFERSGNQIRIEVDVQQGRGWGWNDGGDGDSLEIFIPQNSRIDYESTNANVEVEQIYGGAKVETVNGRIDVKGLKGKILLEAVNGDIRARDMVSSKLKIETVNGDIRDQNSQGARTNYETVNGDIDADTTSKDIAAETVNGSIELELQQVNDLNLNTVNGSIEAQMQLLKDASVRASTVGGSVDLTFPKDVSARFDIQGHAGGRISNNLSSHKPQKAKYGPSRWLTFSHNGGEGTVDISTVSGRVKLNAK